MTTPSDAPTTDRYDVPTGALAAWSHALHAAEVGLLEAYVEARSWRGTMAVEGMPLDDYARLVCRRSRGEVIRLRRIAERIRLLPDTHRAFRLGFLTLAQLGAVCDRTALLTDAETEQVDGAVADAAFAGATMSPDRPLAICDAHVRQLLSAREAQDAEDAAVASVHLVLQPSLLGGGDIKGHLDDEGFAMLVGSVEVAAGPPSPDTPRSQQLAEGLVALAAQRADGGRARPQVVVHVDLADVTDTVGGTLSLGRPGPAPTITARSLEALACYADLVVQLTEGERPLVRIASRTEVPAMTRQAVLSRDRGCRWPGCDAPAAWVDVHHIVHRADGGDHDPDNLVALCRPHHLQAHRQEWELALDPITGSLVCRRNGTLLESRPRGRPGALEVPDPQPDLWELLDVARPLPAWA